MAWQSAGRLAALTLFGATLAALAVSQAYAVHDLVRVVHAAWPLWATWAMAGGFEGAVLSVAFGLAVLGESEGRRLWVAEIMLVGLSIAVGAIGVYSAGHDRYTVGVVSLMPLQYLAVAEAGRRVLLRWWPQTMPVPAPRPRRQPAEAPKAPEASAAAPEPRKVVRQPKSAPAPDATLTPERQRLAAKYAATARQVGDSPELVSQALSRPARSIRRWRRDAETMGLLAT